MYLIHAFGLFSIDALKLEESKILSATIMLIGNTGLSKVDLKL